MTNIAIDIGNSVVKIALGNSTVVEKYEQHTVLTPEVLDDFSNKTPIQQIIVSNVGTEYNWIEDWSKEKSINFHHYSITSKSALTNSYLTPKTLGLDRLAAANGAWALYPWQNILLFDAGTALTIDFISAEGEFMGGNISPGMHMRLKALHTYTQKLPLVEIEDSISLIGKSTKHAILNGVINGMCQEIEGYITKWNEEKKDIKILITGGDADFFVKMIKKPIFVEQNLVVKGLFKTLEYND